MRLVNACSLTNQLSLSASMSAESSEDAAAGDEQASARQPEGTQQQAAAAPASPRRHSHEHVRLMEQPERLPGCASRKFDPLVTERKRAGHEGHPGVRCMSRNLPHHSRPCCRPAAATRSMPQERTAMSGATAIGHAEMTRGTGMSIVAATTAIGQPCL